ncbi:MAG: hypothetical protein R6U91_04955 [Bacillota bacterium]
MIIENKRDIYAVLTGDIVKSAKLDSVNLKVVIQSIKDGQARFNTAYPGAIIGQADIFSGDSWQVLMEHVHLSIRAVLYFRAVVKAVKGLSADTRIALAWGKIDESTINPERISESTGEAFTLSGRALAEMDKSRRLVMKLPDALVKNKLNDYAFLSYTLLLLEEITNNWTEKQAEAIIPALLGVKQKTIAVELGLVQSTVNKRLNGAGWKNLSQYLDFIEYRLKARYLP